MGMRHDIQVVARRDVVIGAAAVALVFATFIGGAGAQKDKPTLGGFDEALKKILGEAKPADGKPIGIDIPDIAENGNTVPFTITVESPMTESNYVKALHILATGNPQSGIGSFFFSPLSGRAFVQSRMRLARTQEIVIVSEMSDGRFHLARRSVKVTIGGCGG